MVDWARWLRVSGLALPFVLGCGDDDTIASTGTGTGTGTSTTTGADSETGEPLDLCESALDPSIYVAPPWTPTPFVGTPDCPAVDGPFVLALSTITVGGMVRMEGIPTQAHVSLVGRGNEGTANVYVADDGTFTTSILPGHYDVWVRNAPGALVGVERLFLQDVDLTAPADLDLDVPPLATVTGTMTIDGEPAADPLGHIYVKEVGSSRDDPLEYALVARMDQGTYAIQLAPGTYEFQYSACDPHWNPDPKWGENPCHDPEVGEPLRPYASPDQTGVPIATEVVVTDDMQLDLDVRTVRLSGSVEVAGWPYPHVDASIHTSDGVGYIYPAEEGFDVRAIVGTYELRIEQSAPVIEELVLDEDTHLELSVDYHTLSVSLDPERPAIDIDYYPGPLAWIWGIDAGGQWDIELPAGDPIQVFSGTYRIDHTTRYCWPDWSYEDREPPLVHTRIHEALSVTESMAVELTTPELARIELEYADVGTSEVTVFSLFPIPASDPFTSDLTFLGDEPFVTHGIVPAGTYRIRDEIVEIVDGMRLHVVEESQWVELQLLVDGVPVEAEARLRLRDQGAYDEGGELVRPGRYEITYSGSNDEQPRNQNAIVGCITVEG